MNTGHANMANDPRERLSVKEQAALKVIDNPKNRTLWHHIKELLIYAPPSLFLAGLAWYNGKPYFYVIALVPLLWLATIQILAHWDLMNIVQGVIKKYEDKLKAQP
jgi:hypothetical protein